MRRQRWRVLYDPYGLSKKSKKKFHYNRVATHSGKLKVFLSYRKSQGNLGNFDSFFLTQGNSGQFWFFQKFLVKF